MGNGLKQSGQTFQFTIQKQEKTYQSHGLLANGLDGAGVVEGEAVLELVRLQRG